MFAPRFVLLALGLCLLGPVHEAAADEVPDPDKAIHLPEVVVRGKPILEDTRLDSLGSPMAIITSRQIDDMNALDLPSALRRVPGVSISRYNLVGGYGGGDGGAIFLRGQGSGRPGAEIATLFDGVPRFAGVWIHPIMDAFALDGAQGIEVHKSPQPVLDGNMAFGSVNMVPRRRAANGTETYLKGMVGEHATRSGEVRHGGRSGRFDYYLAAGRKQSDGHRALAEGRTESLYGRIGYELASGWDWSFQADHTNADVQDPGSTLDPWPVADPAFRVPTFGSDTELYLATLGHRIGPATGNARIYLDHGRIDWWQWDSPIFGQPPESFRSISDYDNYGIHVHEMVPLPGDVRLIAGFDQDFYGGSAQEKHASGDGPKIVHRFRNRAPYAAASRTFALGGSGWRMTPTAGVRANDSRYFGSDHGWQVSADAIASTPRSAARSMSRGSTSQRCTTCGIAPASGRTCARRFSTMGRSASAPWWRRDSRRSSAPSTMSWSPRSAGCLRSCPHRPHSSLRDSPTAEPASIGGWSPA